MIETAPEGFVHLEYYQGAVKVLNRRSKVDSISFAIPSPLSLISIWRFSKVVTEKLAFCCALCLRCTHTPQKHPLNAITAVFRRYFALGHSRSHSGIAAAGFS